MEWDPKFKMNVMIIVITSPSTGVFHYICYVWIQGIFHIEAIGIEEAKFAFAFNHERHDDLGIIDSMALCPIGTLRR